MKNNKILDSDQIERKFQRMARQLLEAHHSESEIILMGIEGQGQEVAIRLQTILAKIGELKIHIKNIKLDKENPLSKEIVCNASKEEIQSKVVVIVDDVLNSG
ncbi:MAG: phosphoribosyltransferase family protein, partial [Flavobacteriales bacterium]